MSECSQCSQLLPEYHGQATSYKKQDKAADFLKGCRTVRIISQLFSCVTFAMGIWILTEVREFYSIAYSLANQSGYKEDLEVHFLEGCRFIGYVLTGASLVGIIFGILKVWKRNRRQQPPPTLQKEKHRCPSISSCFRIRPQIDREDRHPSLEVAGLAERYTSLPTELTGEGTVIIVSSPDNKTSDPMAMRTTLILNTLQIMMKCCGTESGYEDFRNAPYFVQTFPIFAPPVFCCNFEDRILRTLSDRRCYTAAARLSGHISNAEKGCVVAVMDYRRTHFTIWSGTIFFVVLLQFLIHLVEEMTKRFISDKDWRNAQKECVASTEILQKDLHLDRIVPSNKEYKESYRDSMNNLEATRKGITGHISDIIRYLQKKHPGSLSEAYSELANDVLTLIENCKESMWRVCQASPFHTVKPFDFHASVDLMWALSKIRKSCERILSNPTLSDKEKPKIRKQVLDGASRSYNQCHKAAREAATSATFKLFAYYAKEITTASGALLNDLQSALLDGNLLRDDAIRLNESGVKIGTYFTASSLLTLRPHPRQQEAERQIKGFAQEVVNSIVAFLQLAGPLTVLDHQDFEVNGVALRAHEQAVIRRLDVLCKYIEYTVPGLMDCTSILDNINTLRKSNWQQLNELADQTRPLPDYCVERFDVSKMRKVLDRIARAARHHELDLSKGIRNRDMMYKMGQCIIELDCHRRFLQLETCGLASKTLDPMDAHKLVNILFSICEKYIQFLHTCQAYLYATQEVDLDSTQNRQEPVKKQLFPEVKAQVYAVKVLTDEINEELELLNNLHYEIRGNRGYNLGNLDSQLEETTVASDGVKDNLFKKLPDEQSPEESDSDSISTSESDEKTALNELPENLKLDGAANQSQFKDAQKNITKKLNHLRWYYAFYVATHSTLTRISQVKTHIPKVRFTAAQLASEVSAFWKHVDQLITAVKKANDIEVAYVAYFNELAIQRLCEASKNAASSSGQLEEGKRILKACWNVGELYTEVLRCIDEEFRDADPENLERLRSGIAAGLTGIQLEA